MVLIEFVLMSIRDPMLAYVQNKIVKNKNNKNKNKMILLATKVTAVAIVS